MPLLAKRIDDDGNESWMCGNCFGYVAPRDALPVPMTTPSGREIEIPHCIPCADSVDFSRP